MNQPIPADFSATKSQSQTLQARKKMLVCKHSERNIVFLEIYGLTNFLEICPIDPLIESSSFCQILISPQKKQDLMTSHLCSFTVLLICMIFFKIHVESPWFPPRGGNFAHHFVLCLCVCVIYMIRFWNNPLKFKHKLYFSRSICIKPRCNLSLKFLQLRSFSKTKQRHWALGFLEFIYC